MAKKDISAPAVPAMDGATTPPAAPVVEDALVQKLAELRRSNAAAVQTLGAHFGERWPKLIQLGERRGLNADQLASLAGKMVRTRKERHPNNEQAALLGAGLGFLCALGMNPTDEENAAFEAALAAGAPAI